MNKVIKYDNGLRISVDYMPDRHSVAAGIWVGAGSARETEEINGISHFTEHMLFKGTKNMSPYDIADAFEGLGATVNAFTGKESTCYYVKCIDQFSEKCFDILSDIFLNSTFDKGELDKERKVIVEEINMVEDSPEDICYDLIAKSMHPNCALGQTILGPIKNINSFSKKEVDDYMGKLYTADNIVVAFAGNIDIDQADMLVRKYFLPYVCTNASSKNEIEFSVKSNFAKRIKDFEQSNIAITYPSLKFNDKLSATQNLLSIILGGGMSSRLFQNIREQQGLAYSVYTAPSHYASGGAFNIILNISPQNTQKVVLAVREELDKLISGGITEKEFLRAKAQLKSSSIFLQESAQSLMTAEGKLLLLANDVYNMEQRIANMDKITINQVQNFAENVFSGNVCAAYVGKETDVDILGIMKNL